MFEMRNPTYIVKTNNPCVFIGDNVKIRTGTGYGFDFEGLVTGIEDKALTFEYESLTSGEPMETKINLELIHDIEIISRGLEYEHFIKDVKNDLKVQNKKII